MNDIEICCTIEIRRWNNLNITYLQANLSTTNHMQSECIDFEFSFAD